MRFLFCWNRDSVKNGILISIRRTGDGFHPGLFIQHLFGRFSIFFLVLIVAVFAEEYSIDRLCLNINGFPFIFMNAFMIVGIAYIYQKATRKLFIA